MKKFIPYILIAWSLLAFVGYNVLTVQATEEKDLSDAIREMKFTNDDEDDTGLKPIAIKQACKDNGGQWKDNAWCKFDKDKTGDEVEFEHQLEDRGLSYYYADNEYLGEEWDKYQAEKQEKELLTQNPNNKDSDHDGIYDDEELSEEEEKALAKSKGADEMTDKEKKKLDEENQKVVDEWVKDELKATEDELRAMTASKPNYDK